MISIYFMFFKFSFKSKFFLIKKELVLFFEIKLVKMIKRLLFVAAAIVDVALVFNGYYDWKMAGLLLGAFIIGYIILKRFLF
jgi:hypothetical protein